jgi:hypothetical protein
LITSGLQRYREAADSICMRFVACSAISSLLLLGACASSPQNQTAAQRSDVQIVLTGEGDSPSQGEPGLPDSESSASAIESTVAEAQSIDEGAPNDAIALVDAPIEDQQIPSTVPLAAHTSLEDAETASAQAPTSVANDRVNTTTVMSTELPSPQLIDLIREGELDQKSSSWEASAVTFGGLTGGSSYEVVEGNRGLAQILPTGYLKQTVQLPSEAFSPKYFGFGAYVNRGARVTLRFLGPQDEELESFILPPVERFSRVAISRKLPGNAKSALVTVESTLPEASPYGRDAAVDSIRLLVSDQPITLLSSAALTAKRLDKPGEEDRLYTVAATTEIVGPDTGLPIAVEFLRDIQVTEILSVPVANGGKGYKIANMSRSGTKAAWSDRLKNPRGIMSARFWIDANVDGVWDPTEDSVETWMG